MRYTELFLTEDAIREGFLDDITRAIGDKAAETVTVVNNTRSAMQVMFKVASDQHWLETVTFLLKKSIKTKLKSFSTSPLFRNFVEAINHVFPRGQTAKDFVIAIVLVTAINGLYYFIDQVREKLQNQSVEQIKTYVADLTKGLVSVPNLIGSVPGADVVFKIVDGLKLANTLLFEVLAAINEKIANAPMQITEGLDDLSHAEAKFWFNTRTKEWVMHDLDTHHIKIAARDPDQFGLSFDKVAHHPYADPDYRFANRSDFEDDEDEDDGAWSEQDADNNDMGIFETMFAEGWVRGGHVFDLMAYWERGKIVHHGELYLQGRGVRGLQIAVTEAMKKWPDISSIVLEGLPGQDHMTLRGPQAIQHFIRFGTKPRAVS